jgi:type I restriction enzyme S subunit
MTGAQTDISSAWARKLPAGWKNCFLSDVISHTVDNRGRSAPTAEQGIPLIATNCIRDDRLYPVYENVRYVTQETYDTWFRGHPQPGDIIITNKGSHRGRVCMVPDPADFCIAQDMIAMRANTDAILPKYLLAILRSPFFKQEVDAFSVSTTIPHLRKTDFSRLVIPVPSSKEQECIGEMYFSLSKKVELNHQMNHTLEAIAHAIFKSWFVDFDPVWAKMDGEPPYGMDAETASLFPNVFVESELGLVPEGWRIATVGDEAEIVKGQSYRSVELQPSTTALVTLKSFHRGGGYRPDGLKPYIGTYKPEQVVKPGEIVVAYTDITQQAEVIGKPAIVRSDPQYETLVASLDLGIVRPKSQDMSIPYLYELFLTNDFQAHIYGYAGGTTVLHLNKQGIPTYEFVCPPADILRVFHQIAQPLFDRIASNEAESTTLTELRDTLLPKLISGQLRVPEIDTVQRDSETRCT